MYALAVLQWSIITVKLRYKVHDFIRLTATTLGQRMQQLLFVTLLEICVCKLFVQVAIYGYIIMEYIRLSYLIRGINYKYSELKNLAIHAK